MYFSGNSRKANSCLIQSSTGIRSKNSRKSTTGSSKGGSRNDHQGDENRDPNRSHRDHESASVSGEEKGSNTPTEQPHHHGRFVSDVLVESTTVLSHPLQMDTVKKKASRDLPKRMGKPPLRAEGTVNCPNDTELSACRYERQSNCTIFGSRNRSSMHESSESASDGSGSGAGLLDVHLGRIEEDKPDDEPGNEDKDSHSVQEVMLVQLPKEKPTPIPSTSNSHLVPMKTPSDTMKKKPNLLEIQLNPDGPEGENQSPKPPSSHIMKYGSTPYVGMTRQRNGHPIETSKMHSLLPGTAERMSLEPNGSNNKLDADGNSFLYLSDSSMQSASEDILDSDQKETWKSGEATKQTHSLETSSVLLDDDASGNPDDDDSRNRLHVDAGGTEKVMVGQPSEKKPAPIPASLPSEAGHLEPTKTPSDIVKKKPGLLEIHTNPDRPSSEDRLSEPFSNYVNKLSTPVTALAQPNLTTHSLLSGTAKRSEDDCFEPHSMANELDVDDKSSQCTVVLSPSKTSTQSASEDSFDKDQEESMPVAWESNPDDDDSRNRLYVDAGGTEKVMVGQPSEKKPAPIPASPPSEAGHLLPTKTPSDIVKKKPGLLEIHTNPDRPSSEDRLSEPFSNYVNKLSTPVTALAQPNLTTHSLLSGTAKRSEDDCSEPHSMANELDVDDKSSQCTVVLSPSKTSTQSASEDSFDKDQEESMPVAWESNPDDDDSRNRLHVDAGGTEKVMVGLPSEEKPAPIPASPPSEAGHLLPTKTPSDIVKKKPGLLEIHTNPDRPSSEDRLSEPFSNYVNKLSTPVTALAQPNLTTHSLLSGTAKRSEDDCSEPHSMANELDVDDKSSQCTVVLSPSKTSAQSASEDSFDKDQEESMPVAWESNCEIEHSCSAHNELTIGIATSENQNEQTKIDIPSGIAAANCANTENEESMFPLMKPALSSEPTSFEASNSTGHSSTILEPIRSQLLASEPSTILSGELDSEIPTKLLDESEDRITTEEGMPFQVIDQDHFYVETQVVTGITVPKKLRRKSALVPGTMQLQTKLSPCPRHLDPVVSEQSPHPSHDLPELSPCSVPFSDENKNALSLTQVSEAKDLSEAVEEQEPDYLLDGVGSKLVVGSTLSGAEPEFFSDDDSSETLQPCISHFRSLVDEPQRCSQQSWAPEAVMESYCVPGCIAQSIPSQVSSYHHVYGNYFHY